MYIEILLNQKIPSSPEAFPESWESTRSQIDNFKRSNIHFSFLNDDIFLSHYDMNNSLKMLVGYDYKQ